MFFDPPRPEDLGPDPEPPGARTAPLLERVPPGQRRAQRPGTPAVCPIAMALGRSEACRAADCPWFRVPGTVRPCAIEQWAPAARRDPRVARWFEVRRKEIMAGRGIWAQRDRNL